MKARTLPAPDAEAAAAFVRRHLGVRLLQIFGSCTVIYEGRASSTLADGDRLVLLKPDGSLLVHQGQGVKPVNWQPPGTGFGVDVEHGCLLVTGMRAKPRELVRILFNEVHLLCALKLQDAAAINLVGSEADIAGRLRDRPGLIEPGLQLLGQEVERRRGPMDLVATDAKGRRVVIELKRRKAGIKEATQLWRYVDRERSNHGPDVRGLLVAPGCSQTAMRFLHDHQLDHVDLDLDELLERTAPRGATQRGLDAF